MKKMIFLISAFFMMMTMVLQVSVFAQGAEDSKDKRLDSHRAHQAGIEKSKDKPLEISGFIDILATARFGQGKSDLGKGGMNLYLLGVNFDGKFGNFGYHATVHLTGAGIRPGGTTKTAFADYASPVWLEEGYVYADLGSNVKVKVGSVYVPFGLQGDNSWYLGIHYYSGISLDADYGVVGDFNFEIGKSIDFNFTIAYFMNDDNQNGTRNAGNADISIENDANAYERDKIVARIAPTFKFGAHTLGIGASLMMGRVTAITGGEDSKQQLFEFDADFNASFGKVGLRLFGEFVIANRNKDNITSFVSPSKKYNLWLAGATLSYEVGSSWLKSIDLHGNYGQIIRKNTENRVTSDQLIIGSALGLSDKFTITLEYVFGKANTSLGASGNRFEDILLLDFFFEF